MHSMISVFAYSNGVLVDGARVQEDIRPVLQKGQVMLPPRFFERVFGKKLPETEDMYVPAVQTARRLGIGARQFGRMVVFAQQEKLNVLEKDEDALQRLTQRTCGIFDASGFTGEDFRAAREAWRKDLCGDEKSNDPAIPGMRNLLALRDEDSDRLRAQMNRGQDAPVLFGDTAPTMSRDLRLQYDRVLRMAQPYGTVGCKGYKDKELLKDVLFALEWMHDNMYGANVLTDTAFRSYKLFNWWHWMLGAPMPMMDTLMIIAEDIPKALIRKFTLPAAFICTQMATELNATHAMTRILLRTPLSLLTEDAAMLQADYIDMEMLLEEHDTGDCMRRDWCCMTHGMPYNINYGSMNLDRAARVIHILEDSPLKMPLVNKYNLMQMVRYCFAPVLFDGRGLALMNGRYIQEHTGAFAAHKVLQHFRNLFGLFGEEEDQELYAILARNATPDIIDRLISAYDKGVSYETYEKINTSEEDPYATKTHLASYGQYYAALHSAQQADAPYELGYMWYTGDSCVQFRAGHMAAMRMNSCRTMGYECINGQNGDGWYTGDGMLYVYTKGAPEEYGDAWWKNVDKYHMPGTTVEQRAREVMYFKKAYRSHQDFAGGVDVDGQFVTAAFDLESFHNEVDEGLPDEGYGRSLPVYLCTLTAKKAYFMLDKAVAALGTQVTAKDGYAVYTVVENRMLQSGLQGVRVNGELLAEDFVRMTREDIRSVYIPHAGGYLFPQGGMVTVEKQEKND